MPYVTTPPERAFGGAARGEDPSLRGDDHLRVRADVDEHLTVPGGESSDATRSATSAPTAATSGAANARAGSWRPTSKGGLSAVVAPSPISSCSVSTGRDAGRSATSSPKRRSRIVEFPTTTAS
jgi:hypothetical protein